MSAGRVVTVSLVTALALALACCSSSSAPSEAAATAASVKGGAGSVKPDDDKCMVWCLHGQGQVGAVGVVGVVGEWYQAWGEGRATRNRRALDGHEQAR
jgi:hypothetical protein